MKRTIQAILILVASLAVTAPAFAHIPASDGQISAVLHTDPDDDIVAGQPAALHLIDLTDSSRRFTAAACSCQVTIKEHGITLRTAALSALETVDGLQIIFPKIDTYDVTVTGQPTTPGAFQSFTLRFAVPVTTVAPAADTRAPHTLVWISIIVIIAAAAAVIVVLRPKPKA